MELRHLRYFIAVAEELNFRRAADRLHIAQPPLSVQIRQIETEVGAELLVRSSRKVRLTEAGRVFLEQARLTLAQVDRALVLTRLTAKGDIGHLSIGCGTAAEFRIFPTLIPAFKQRWPNIHLSFHNLRTPQQLHGLQSGELDVAFAWLPVGTQGMQSEALTREPFVALLAAHHPLASAPALSIKDLSNEPLILFSRALDPELFHQVEQLFIEVGAVLNVSYELDSLVSMLNFVALGVGCTVLPDYVRTLPRAGVVVKPLLGPNLVKTLGVIKSANKSGLADTFYRFTVETFAAGRSLAVPPPTL